MQIDFNTPEVWYASRYIVTESPPIRFEDGINIPTGHENQEDNILMISKYGA